jgi:hypothetical protein
MSTLPAITGNSVLFTSDSNALNYITFLPALEICNIRKAVPVHAMKASVWIGAMAPSIRYLGLNAVCSRFHATVDLPEFNQ